MKHLNQMDKSFCDYILGIGQNPEAIPERLTIGEFAELKLHVDGCKNCKSIVDDVCEKGKNRPQRPDSSSLN